MAILSGSGKHLNPFDLQIDLCDQSNVMITRANAIKMTPRSSTASTSAGYGFGDAGDYQKMRFAELSDSIGGDFAVRSVDALEELLSHDQI